MHYFKAIAEVVVVLCKHFLLVAAAAFVSRITHQWEGPDLKRGGMPCGLEKLMPLSLSPPSPFSPPLLLPSPCVSLVQPLDTGFYKHWMISRTWFVNTSLTQSQGRQPFHFLDNFIHFLLLPFDPL